MKRLGVVHKSAEPSEETDRWKQKVDPESLKVVMAANAALTFHNFSNTISPSSVLSAHSTDVNWAMLSTQSCCLIPGSDYTDFSVWLSDKMTRQITYWMIIACLLSWTVWSHQEGVAEIKTRIYKQCCQKLQLWYRLACAWKNIKQKDMLVVHQHDMLKLKLSITMVKKGGVLVGMLICCDFISLASIGFSENGLKKSKYPVSSSSLNKKPCTLSGVRVNG